MLKAPQDCRQFEDDNTVLLWLLSDDEKMMQAVLKCLYNLYASSCMSWLINRLGGKLTGQIAEHNAQEAFNESIKTLCEYVREKRFVLDGRPNGFRRYIYRVSHNVYYQLKKKLIREQGIFTELGNAGDHAEPFYVPSMETKDQVIGILQLINSMHETCREIIRLKFMESYKVSEIAEIMNIDSDLVSTRLHRCRPRFMELLSNYNSRN